MVNQDGIPLRILLTKGNMSDMNKKILEPLVNGFENFTILADKGYDVDWLRDKLENPVIPGRSNRKIKIKYDEDLYKKRNIVERFFMWIKRYRRINTIYEQTGSSFMGMINIVSTKKMLNRF